MVPWPGYLTSHSCLGVDDQCPYRPALPRLTKTELVSAGNKKRSRRTNMSEAEATRHGQRGCSLFLFVLFVVWFFADEKTVLQIKPRPNPLFQKCRPKKHKQQRARAVQPLHHHPSVKRPAAVRRPRPLPPHPSSLRPETSTKSPSRFGRNTFARNF